jgi:FkbM family methyltransferase
MERNSNVKLLTNILLKSPMWAMMVTPRNFYRFLPIANAYLISQALGWRKCIDHFNGKLINLYGQKIGKSMIAFRIPGVGRLVFPLESGWIVVEIFVFGVYERSFKPSTNSTLIDIGAHAGSFTIKMAKKVHNIIAFEPNPRTFRFLVQNIELNELENVTAVNVALSNKQGTTKLSLGDASHLSTIMRPDNNCVEVLTETLDGIVAKLGVNHVDFIKLDAEGAESIILLGGIKTLKSNKPKIAMEIHSQSQAEKISKILLSLGYETLCLRDILYASHKAVSTYKSARKKSTETKE